jgi:hypothetical protein
MSLDSVAVFEERVRLLELSEHLERFRAQGWTTLGNFAFASDFVPGVSDGEIFVKDVVVPGLADPAHPDRLKLRRLYVEAYTLAAYEMRRRCEAADDDAPRRLPVLEREARRGQVARRLVGHRIEGELDPSYRLQDLAYELYDQNVVKHLPWELCTKREAELQGTKSEKAWRVDSAGFLKESATDEPAKADTRSDYLLVCALRRRAIALEMADVVSFDTMECITDTLMREYRRAPPPGYARVSLEQLRRADQEVFRQLSELCRSGVRRGADGRRPFDVHIPKILETPMFRYLVMPLPGGAPNRSTGDDSAASASKRTLDLQQSIRDLRNENKRLRASRAAASPTGGSQQSAGKGGGKGRGGKSQGKGSGVPHSMSRMPAPLIGKSSRTPSGAPICFAYNMESGCTQASPGAQCPKGMHVCAEPGCAANHSLLQHGRS